jgi:hypothetical protein
VRVNLIQPDFLGQPVDPSKLDNVALSPISRGRFPDQLSNLQILKGTAKCLIFFTHWFYVQLFIFRSFCGEVRRIVSVLCDLDVKENANKKCKIQLHTNSNAVVYTNRFHCAVILEGNSNTSVCYLLCLGFVKLNSQCTY